MVSRLRGSPKWGRPGAGRGRPPPGSVFVDHGVERFAARVVVRMSGQPILQRANEFDDRVVARR